MFSLPLLQTQPQRPIYATGPKDLASVRLLRISVTDRCNLRCIYCMPEDGVAFSPQDDLLSPDDFHAIANAATRLGIRHFKITGGEPTVRTDLLNILERFTSLEPHDLSLTTNGMLLHKLAQPLREVGVHRLTVSWDTLKPDRFEALARGGARSMGGLTALRRGIDAAVHAGYDRLKINTVIIGGRNDDEAVDFARLTLEHPWTIRFIEYMPLGQSTLADSDEHGWTVDNQALRARIEAALGPMTPIDRGTEPGVGPANVYQLPGAPGRIGFISAMSRPFCESCNRLRLTATGELRSCLFDGGEVNVLPTLRDPHRPGDPQRLIELMRQCVALRPDLHSPHGNRAMSQVGG